MARNTLTLRDNSTGKEAEFAMLRGTIGTPVVDVSSLNNKMGLFTYDPGFMSTASCNSAITYIDGEKGILLYRGYPIDQLAEKCTFLDVAYLLMNGELGNKPEQAQFEHEIGQHAMLHEAMRSFIDGFHYDAHPMAMMVGIVGSLSAFYHSELNMDDPEHRRISAMRMVAKIPVIAAACHRHSIGYPYVYPRSDLSYCENFLNMMFSLPSHKYIDKDNYIRAFYQHVVNSELIADHKAIVIDIVFIIIN